MPTKLIDALTVHPLANGFPPRWASEWGDDRYGPWAAFQFGEVRQRFRWIPPGIFWMGSPGDEEERWEDEGPRRLMRIRNGFWIFESPCTQALWKAVTGENPSGFQHKYRPEGSSQRPVENVSWDQCVEFARSLNQSLEGLVLALPSEAQWEYACRAGTLAPRYAEDLDAITWYDGNSGGQTHPVGGKRPNFWGRHDVLGNVWEWCDDYWTDDYAATDQAARPRHSGRLVGQRRAVPPRGVSRPRPRPVEPGRQRWRPPLRVPGGVHREPG